VFTEAGLDRRYYELCALTELRNALRSGDIWVPGSRQFKDFEDYLLPTAAFEALLRSDSVPLVIGGSFDRYWTERETLLRHELQKARCLCLLAFERSGPVGEEEKRMMWACLSIGERLVRELLAGELAR
jgi:hypothetical protein